MVKDVYAGYQSSVTIQGLPYFTYFGGNVFFVAEDATTGREVWKSDGTIAGTTMVFDVYPGLAGSQPEELASAGSRLFFSARDEVYTRKLWVTDGFVTSNITPDGMTFPVGFCNLNGIVFFAAYTTAIGSEFWKSDGTLTGTVLVKDIFPGGGAAPHSIVNVNDTLLFIAEDSHGEELWKSDGTEAGTVIVKDINPGSGSGLNFMSKLVAINNTVYFSAVDNTGDYELWKSDGTAAGTLLVKDINTSGSSYPSGLANINGTLFFTALNSTNTIALFKSDGTSAGTIEVKMFSLPVSVGIWNITNVNGTAFFMIGDQNQSSGSELWKSDGTASGTVMVKAANVGGSYMNDLVGINETLYFTANDAATGIELWRSDGTEAGTAVFDLVQGDGSSVPRYLTNMNGTLFFTAYNDATGYEPWALNTGAGLTIPTAPSNLTIIPLPLKVGAALLSSILLQWNDNSDNESGFFIERSPDGLSAWALVQSVDSNITTFTDTGLTASTIYFYRVSAFNAAGNSFYSNTASASTITSVKDDEYGFNANCSVFPNPFSSVTNIIISAEVKSFRGMQIILYNVRGKIVKQTAIRNYRTALEKADLPCGIYFYSLLNNESVIATGKLIIQ